MLERLAIQKLHGDEVLPLVLINLINRADVGMIERGGGSGLALEALERLRVFSQLFRQELEGNGPAEFQILGLVDDAHAPAPELFQNPEVRNGLADQLGQP